VSAPAEYRLRELRLADYDTVMALWQRSEGIGLNESDTRDAIAAFLSRNVGLSAVAVDAADAIVGAVLCGHDGRRGYLHHLAVAAGQRRRGIGAALVERCLAHLRAAGIPKCSIFLYADNHAGRSFWLRHGWAAREDLVIVQRTLHSANG
jgi:N-acetylglutamate synthase